jgi:formyl-CoA transferase
VLIAANQDTVFQRLPRRWASRPRGRPALCIARRTRRESTRARRARRSWTQTLTTREVLDLMDAFGVPPGLIYRAPEMLEDPHFKAREAIVSVPHPDFGELRMQNVAPKLSETPGEHPLAESGLGQHNDEVYPAAARTRRERYEQLKSQRII